MILFYKTNYLICGFPDSGMRRHADKFRQKRQMENSRHTVIKRERIGLNWFKEVPLLAILTGNVSSNIFA